MQANPEFQRNLWLEFTPHRLIGMPLVLGAVFYLLSSWGGGLAGLPEHAGSWGYVLMVVLWGTRAAAESVAGEVAAHTWDGQRLSPLGAWTMTWGKLFGATAYAWYGGLLCLAVHVAGLSRVAPPAAVLHEALFMLLAGVLAHAVAFLTALQALRKRAGTSRGRSIGFHLLGVLAALPVLVLSGVPLELYGAGSVYWWGRSFPALGFWLASVTLFTGWAVLGCERVMRAELQMRNSPWVWLGFALYLMVYVAGLVDLPVARASGAGLFRLFSDPLTVHLFTVYMVAMSLVYAMALWETKSPVLARRWLRYARHREWPRLLEITPRWLLGLPLAGLAALAVVALHPPLDPAARGLFDPDAFVTALFAFLLRDVALLLLLNLAPDPRRADTAWVLYMGVLYLLAPALAGVLGLGAHVGFFLPRPDVGFLGGVLPPAAQAAVLWWLVAARWRERYSRAAMDGARSGPAGAGL